MLCNIAAKKDAELCLLTVKLSFRKRQGLVGDHFIKEVIKKLPGKFAIDTNRYSTTGETSLRNIQPFFADLHMGGSCFRIMETSQMHYP